MTATVFKQGNVWLAKLLERYLSFEGRINTSSFWKSVFVGAVLAGIGAYALSDYDKTSTQLTQWILVGCGATLTLSAIVRRHHDLNHSGWWVALVPCIALSEYVLAGSVGMATCVCCLAYILILGFRPARRTFQVFKCGENEIEIIKVGFSWPALFFGVFWMVAKCRWEWVFIYGGLSLMLVLMGTGVAGSPDGYAPGIVLMNLGSLALWLVPAFMGNAWLARAKEEAGFRLHRVVEAADASSAKQQATTDSV